MASPQPIPQRSYVFQPGKAAVGAQVNHELDTLYSVLQGGVADAHISGQANISGSKLAAGSVPLAQLTSDAAFQPGMIIHYASAAVPIGWLRCDGSAVSRTTYVNLFSSIGTMFGQGDGSTTFNLPPQGVVMVNISDTDTNFNSIGKTGGEDSHALTSQENGPHFHPVGLNIYVNTGLSGSGNNLTTPDSGGGIGGYSVNTGVSGSGAAHNNLQPYVTVPMIIKY